MFVLGLTGSIATGKSTALAMFAEKGVATYSADAAVHALYQGEAVAPVGEKFPEAVRGGVIDRAALSAILLAQPERLAELEAIVHPLVRKKLLGFVASAAADGAELAVLEIPLLFEAGKAYPVDAIAITACSEDEQRRRALARPGMTVEKLETILARQLPQAEKRKQADFVIETGDGLDAARLQVETIIAQCVARDSTRTPSGGTAGKS